MPQKNLFNSRVRMFQTHSAVNKCIHNFPDLKTIRLWKLLALDRSGQGRVAFFLNVWLHLFTPDQPDFSGPNQMSSRTHLITVLSDITLSKICAEGNRHYL